MEHDEITAALFSGRANHYRDSESHSRGDDLDIVELFAAPSSEHACLDVATGAGHTALRLAAKACIAVGIDIAPRMLVEAAKLARERRIHNVVFLKANAESLPFPDKHFDIVTCRIAPHHFSSPHAFTHESSRVLRPGGTFVLEDSIAEDDEEMATLLNLVEVQRDQSHVRSLSVGEWLGLCGQCGLHVDNHRLYEKSRSFLKWAERGGLSGASISDLWASIERLPARFRHKYFPGANASTAQFTDQKLILKASKVAGR